MAQARLNALKAQRQAASASSNSTPGTNNVELSTFPTTTEHDLSSTTAFLAEATALQDAISALSASVARIGTLNARTLDAVGDADIARARDELDALVADTRARSQALKTRLQRLQDAVLPRGGSRQDAEMRQNRATFVRTKFVEALQAFQLAEREQRAKARARAERQIRIVKADATQEEINQALDSGQGNQVFMQALTSSSNYVQARSAYNEVQARSQDLRKMEQTMAELAQLFVDMDLLVSQQNDTLLAIENNAQQVEDDTQKADEEVGVAVKHARSARQKRWICCIIILIIVIILAVALAIEIPKVVHK